MMVSFALLISVPTTVYAQNQTQKSDVVTGIDRINIEDFTPVVGYKTESGGFPGKFSHMMFDTNTRKVISMTNESSIEVSAIGGFGLQQFLNKVMNSNFFTMTSPPPSECADCINYIITITIPTTQGSLSNTLSFDSVFLSTKDKNPNAKMLNDLIFYMDTIERVSHPRS